MPAVNMALRWWRRNSSRFCEVRKYPSRCELECDNCQCVCRIAVTGMARRLSLGTQRRIHEGCLEFPRCPRCPRSWKVARWQDEKPILFVFVPLRSVLWKPCFLRHALWQARLTSQCVRRSRSKHARVMWKGGRRVGRFRRECGGWSEIGVVKFVRRFA